MSRSTIAIIMTAVMGGLVGCASNPSSSTNDARVDGSELLGRYASMRPRDEFSDDTSAVNIVREEAILTGTQAGFYWASTEINLELIEHEHLLNQIDFRPLLIEAPRYYIIPPVITEDEGTRLIAGSGRSIRLIDKSYYIEQEPRFALDAPAWQDYLLLNASPPQRPAEALLGSNKEEIEVWERGLQEGWSIGVEQAYLTLRNKVVQLTNDYQGMIRYHVLLTHNMVSEPQIQESYQGVAGGGRRLVIEESNVSIKVNPALNSNRYSWEVVPQLPDISHIFPERIYLNTERRQ